MDPSFRYVKESIRAIARVADELMQAAFAAHDGLPAPWSGLDQGGLRDGKVIVEDYIDHNEFGVAFDHLIYMIKEPPLHLPDDAFDRLQRVATELGYGPEHVRCVDPLVVFGALPRGWTLERVHAMGVVNAARLPLSTFVVEDRRPLATDYVELEPLAIIDCGGLVLVLDRHDQEWHMGQQDDDGSVICWGSYGSNLSAAIEAL